MIYLGSDHRGFELKEKIISVLDEMQLEYYDFGTNSDESVDFPDYAFQVAEKVGESSLQGGDDLGILFCGSGVGMDIAANKVKGVRAALALTEYMGSQSREHDDANILVLAGKVINDQEAITITKAFLNAEFDQDENHARRLEKIKQYENKN